MELWDWAPWLDDDCWLNPPKLGMMGCMMLTNGLIDCEKLLNDELC